MVKGILGRGQYTRLLPRVIKIHILRQSDLFWDTFYKNRNLRKATSKARRSTYIFGAVLHDVELLEFGSEVLADRNLHVAIVAKVMKVVLEVREYEGQIDSAESGQFGCLFKQPNVSRPEADLQSVSPERELTVLSRLFGINLISIFFLPILVYDFLFRS